MSRSPAWDKPRAHRTAQYSDTLLGTLVLSEDQLVAGEPVTVSWRGANRTGAPLLGNWTDAVYLSRDDRWDINDLFLEYVPHTGGLGEGEDYSATATVIPAQLPGDYRILVRADVFNQEREGEGEVDNLIASAPFPLSVRPLGAGGGPVTGHLRRPDDPVDYYAIPVGGNEGLLLHLDASGLLGQVEVAVEFESIPTRLRYDAQTFARGNSETSRASADLAATAPAGGGTYYVMLYGTPTLFPAAYSLSATVDGFAITAITPESASNRPPRTRTDQGRPEGRVIPSTVTVNGTGFDAATTVEFVAANGTVRSPVTTRLLSPSTMVLDLNTSGWSAGVYNVRVRKGIVHDTRPGAFTVIEGALARLETRLIVPSAVGVGLPIRQTLWVEYANTGGAAMPAPILKVEGTHGARLTADPAFAVPVAGFGEAFGASAQVQLLATGSGNTPGVLQPGDSGRIPIYYLGLSDPTDSSEVTFSLSELTADDVSWSLSTEGCRVFRIGDRWAIECTTVETSEDWTIRWVPVTFPDPLRPESIPLDAWDATKTNLIHQIGSQWGYYVEALADNANFLATAGQTTRDVAALWNYEVAQASASLNPVGILAGAVDAAEPAPGLPLSFSRVFGQSILSRYKVGPLGRGWSTNWEVRAERQSNGDVVLRGPGGADRFFTLDRGNYRPSPGDYGSLSLVNGGFRLTETDQTVWQFRTDGFLDFVADSNGNRITLAYTDGRLSALTHSSGAQLFLAYNAVGRIASVTDPLGPGTADDRVTVYEYDNAGEHLVRVMAPGNRVTVYSYDTGSVLPKKHALLSVTYPDGTHDFFAYDARGRLVEMKGDADAGKVTFVYDSAGGVTVTDATGRTTFLAYGLGGQLAQVRDADGRVVNLGYDSRFQLTQLLGPAGEKYAYSYDTRGNLTGVRDPLRQTTGFRYEPDYQQLASFTDARGNGMDYAYDTRGNLTSITYADGSRETFTHDARGNVLTSTNRRGQRLSYTYNAAGQVTSKDDPTTLGIDFIYTYDFAGNLTSARDALGTTTMTYDPATDLLTSIAYPGSHSFAFAYDAAGRRTRRTDEAGNVVNYVYDVAGRLDRMTDGSGALIVDYDYDAAGRLSKKTLGNGVFTTYDYDAAGNVLHLVNRRADGNVLSRFDYTYDASGRRTSMTTLDGTQSYGYDPLGQLTSVAYPDGRVVRYVYDGAGNRVEVSDNGTTTAYSTNALNQYTTVGGVNYTYDADGNMTSKTEDGVMTQYRYDVENRLIGVTTPTDTWTYSYDAFGNRVGATHNGVVTRYVIDPTGLGNVAAEYDGGGQLVARYDHGYGLLNRTDAMRDPAYYTFSAIGHTSELTSAMGDMLNGYSYDPFGVSLAKAETVANPFEYVGEYGVMNEGNGLEFMRARHYQTAHGRFTSPDPIGIASEQNLYRYSSNSPIVIIDPSGLLILHPKPSPGLRVPPALPRVPPDSVAIPTDLPHLDPDDAEDIWDGITPDPPEVPDAPPGVPRSPGERTIVIFPPICDPDEFWCGMDTRYEFSPYAPRLILDPLTPPPDPPATGVMQQSSRTVRSFDPNDKLAPAGFGDSAHIPSDSTLAYTVRFENKSDATAPAREVVVTDVLDPDLDLDTFELTEIAFADQTLAVPLGLDHYEATLPLKANGVDILADVQAVLDRDTRTLTLTLRAVDPATGWFPEDPLTGLLYPNDTTRRGEGSVSYRVAPKAGLPSGTEVTNRARIVFDYNDPIDTPQVLNALDAAAPSSFVLPLPDRTTDTTLPLQWTGLDEPGGSGIATYEILVSVDGAPAITVFDDVTTTSGTVVVEPGHVYAFWSVARDNVGHVELPPETPDAVVIVRGATTTTLQQSSATSNVGSAVTFTATVRRSASGSGTPTGTVRFLDGDRVLASLPLANDGRAVLTTSALTVGLHTLTAVYEGDGVYDGSTSERLTHTVNAIGPVDVSDLVRVVRGGFRYNRVTGRYLQTLTLTNTGSTAITGPISLVLLNLPASVSLFNATGRTRRRWAGSWYLDVLTGTLAPGQSVSVTLEFAVTGGGGISYDTRVLAGAGER